MAKEFTSLDDFRHYMNETNKISADKIKEIGCTMYESSISGKTEHVNLFHIMTENGHINVAFKSDDGRIFDISQEITE